MVPGIKTHPLVFRDWFCGDEHGAPAAVLSGPRGKGRVLGLSPPGLHLHDDLVEQTQEMPRFTVTPVELMPFHDSFVFLTMGG